MDRLHEIEVFVAVAEAGSFAKAGRRLGLSPPAVTRAIASLENRLGARVFNRTTRSLAITDVGHHFLVRARRILADLDVAEIEAVGESAAPQGHLTVTASVTFGRYVVAPIVRTFLDAYPRTTLSLILLDRVANLVEEGIDAAIRIGAMPDSSLVAKRVGAVRRVLVASPRYLERHGRPQTPAELPQHQIIAFTGLGSSREWRFDMGGKSRTVAVAPRLQTNDAETALLAADAGEGITTALSYMVAKRVTDGTLVTLFDDIMPRPVPVHVVHGEGRMMAPKLRAFLDFAAPRLVLALHEVTLPS